MCEIKFRIPKDDSIRYNIEKLLKAENPLPVYGLPKILENEYKFLIHWRTYDQWRVLKQRNKFMFVNISQLQE